MPLTSKQIKFARTLLRKIGIETEEDKKEFLLDFTDGRTGRVTYMTARDLNALYKLTGGNEVVRRQRQINNVIAIAHELGWEDSNGKVDMERVNNWCVKYSSEHCKLDDVPTSQLPKLVTAFKKVHKSYLKHF